MGDMKVDPANSRPAAGCQTLCMAAGPNTTANVLVQSVANLEEHHTEWVLLNKPNLVVCMVP